MMPSRLAGATFNILTLASAHTRPYLSMSAAEVPLIHHLQALSSESVERLPVFNKSALRHYQTSIEADDWSMPSKDPRRMGKQE